DTYTVAITDLKAGAIDAIAVDVTRANEAIAKDDSLALLDEVLGSEQYGIGFRKNDTELCDKVNAALDALVEDGTYDAIGQKYPEIYEYLCLGK
ncbi:MAG: transporter substrate-binding domain-containing protein, partial [Atopobiaceae bacterium]|nr:transporter substrate-binding domain-containing protein [Atopobiaceae bacterium]